MKKKNQGYQEKLKLDIRKSKSLRKIEDSYKKLRFSKKKKLNKGMTKIEVVKKKLKIVMRKIKVFKKKLNKVTTKIEVG